MNEKVKVVNEKVKAHFKKYRVVYISISAVVVAGLCFYAGEKYGSKNVTVNGGGSFTNVGDTINQTFNTTVHNGGHMSKIVGDTDSGEMWLSMKECANAIGARTSDLSKHINGYPGYESLVGGRTFEVVALGSGLV